MDLDLIRHLLAPTGALRAGINMSNRLLVSGTDENGDPVGVSPGVAAEIAARLGVPLKLVKYKGPGDVADAAALGEWDIGNIGAEPERAKTILFTRAYSEIEATYLVREASDLSSVAEVDAPGRRIAVKARSAYGLWLERNVRHAELVLVPPDQDTFQVFADGTCDALAGLRTGLAKDLGRMTGARVLDGRFTAVQQAVGTPVKNAAAFEWLETTVATLIAQGTVQRLIETYQVEGLSVASQTA
ncbi:transporter substrate-binding domain-containing protein [Roseibium sp.]|uniref:transporter substrate-binding domain-containing protein n=1 Tax=Roseibium sp. TaxID=1936156 RepID=UPI003A9818A7